MSNKPNEMKKRTRAEQTAINKARTAKEPKPLGWKDMHNLHRKCEMMFLSIAPALDVMESEQVREALGERVGQMNTMANALKRDVKLYRDQLESIGAEAAGKTGGEDDPTLMLVGLRMGEEYRQWMFSFQTVVLQNVTDIMALAEEAINSKIKDMPAEETTTGETQPEGEAQNG